MTKIQVLGPGCYNCRLLAERVEEAALELGLDYELQKTTDLGEIAELGVFMTPALLIDGEVKVSGRVPPLGKIKEILTGS